MIDLRWDFLAQRLHCRRRPLLSFFCADDDGSTGQDNGSRVLVSDRPRIPCFRCVFGNIPFRSGGKISFVHGGSVLSPPPIPFRGGIYFCPFRRDHFRDNRLLHGQSQLGGRRDRIFYPTLGKGLRLRRRAFDRCGRRHFPSFLCALFLSYRRRRRRIGDHSSASPLRPVGWCLDRCPRRRSRPFAPALSLLFCRWGRCIAVSPCDRPNGRTRLYVRCFRRPSLHSLLSPLRRRLRFFYRPGARRARRSPPPGNAKETSQRTSGPSGGASVCFRRK
mmetsp:Transcript_46758/g.91279  ORF Transcript_46758/g.91279 Transcript_46758/m.91279 type:complete len:276 (-) Transcript_46758:73-900(-)